MLAAKRRTGNSIVEALIVNFQAHPMEIAQGKPEQLMLLAS
jgi:hypothetical protein